MIKSFAKIADIFAIALSILAFYVGGWGVFDNVWVSGLTVWLALIVGFFNFEHVNSKSLKDQLLYQYFIFLWHLFLLGLCGNGQQSCWSKRNTLLI